MQNNNKIRIDEIRVLNFRSLRKTSLQLDEFTILIGENNSGKTSLLEAIYASIGSGKRIITVDDVYLAPGEKKAPKERIILVDIRIVPIDSTGERANDFPEGSFWLKIWGNGISQDVNDDDFVGIRTQMQWNVTKGEYEVKRNFLVDWPEDPDNFEEAKIKKEYVTSSMIEPIALYFLDAKRDIEEELHNRNSFWHKLISDPGLTEQQVQDLEEELNKLNEQIVENSEVLSHVQTYLDYIYKTVSSDKNSISITPLTRHLRDLSRGIDINYSTKDSQSFPLYRHGMGTRSLAAILTFRAYCDWRMKIAETDDVHTMLALEEPEAHLHPQAQKALFEQILDFHGQKIISTHSPYIVSQGKINQFRHFMKNGPDTFITRLDIQELEEHDIRKIQRLVLNTRGEILFAKALIFAEGDTEEIAIPIYAKYYWNKHINSLGLSHISVSGFAYFPFIYLAEKFNIPWFIFSDGEDNARNAINRALKKLSIPNVEKSKNIVILPNKNNFEKYLIENYEDELIEMVINDEKMNARHEKALREKWDSLSNKKDELYNTLKCDKIKYAKLTTETILQIDDEKRKIPSKIYELFDIISDELKLQKS